MPRAVLFDLGPTYLGTHLSDNIAETPEGYRICRNAVIGRSGFQTYRISELTDPDGLLGDRLPSEEIQVWRDPEEVFSKKTLASFEGKTLTLTHPSDLLDPDSEREHHVGHVQNVRKGSDPLDSGDWPMLADIIVTDRDAIRAIDNGERQLSCGYSYRLAKEGYRFDQRDILGNHVALVPKGRAGHEARINDGAPEETVSMSILNTLLKKGFSFSKDAKPEDIAAASRAIALDEQHEERREETKLVQIGKTADGVAIFKLSTALDADPPLTDARDAHHKKMHDALDRMLKDAEEKESNKAAEEDAAVDALKNLFKGKDEEKGDDAHPEDCDCATCKDAKAKDAEEKKGEEGKVEEEGDDAIRVEEPVLKPGEEPQSQFDSAKVLIRALKPFIARSNDAKLKRAFNTAIDSLNAATKKESGGGSYAGVERAARHVAKDADFEESPAQKAAREQDEMYAKEMLARGTRAKK